MTWRNMILTCKNHPTLRWSCEVVYYADDAGYNGKCEIAFLGEPTGECGCSRHQLVLAPEDAQAA